MANAPGQVIEEAAKKVVKGATEGIENAVEQGTKRVVEEVAQKGAETVAQGAQQTIRNGNLVDRVSDSELLERAAKKFEGKGKNLKFSDLGTGDQQFLVQHERELLEASNIDLSRVRPHRPEVPGTIVTPPSTPPKAPGTVPPTNSEVPRQATTPRSDLYDVPTGQQGQYKEVYAQREARAKDIEEQKEKFRPFAEEKQRKLQQEAAEKARQEKLEARLERNRKNNEERVARQRENDAKNGIESHTVDDLGPDAATPIVGSDGKKKSTVINQSGEIGKPPSGESATPPPNTDPTPPSGESGSSSSGYNGGSNTPGGMNEAGGPTRLEMLQYGDNDGFFKRRKINKENRRREKINNQRDWADRRNNRLKNQGSLGNQNTPPQMQDVAGQKFTHEGQNYFYTGGKYADGQFSGGEVYNIGEDNVLRSKVTNFDMNKVSGFDPNTAQTIAQQAVSKTSWFKDSTVAKSVSTWTTEHPTMTKVGLGVGGFLLASKILDDD